MQCVLAIYSKVSWPLSKVISKSYQISWKNVFLQMQLSYSKACIKLTLNWIQQLWRNTLRYLFPFSMANISLLRFMFNNLSFNYDYSSQNMFYDYLLIKCLFRLKISIIKWISHYKLVRCLSQPQFAHSQEIFNQSQNQFEKVQLFAVWKSPWANKLCES